MRPQRLWAYGGRAGISCRECRVEEATELKKEQAPVVVECVYAKEGDAAQIVAQSFRLFLARALSELGAAG